MIALVSVAGEEKRKREKEAADLLDRSKIRLFIIEFVEIKEEVIDSLHILVRDVERGNQALFTPEPVEGFCISHRRRRSISLSPSDDMTNFPVLCLGGCIFACSRLETFSGNV